MKMLEIQKLNPIRKRIDELGISQHAAAKILGIAQPNVQRHYHGKSRLSADSMERYHYRLQISLKEMREHNKRLKPIEG